MVVNEKKKPLLRFLHLQKSLGRWTSICFDDVLIKDLGNGGIGLKCNCVFVVFVGSLGVTQTQRERQAIREIIRLIKHACTCRRESVYLQTAHLGHAEATANRCSPCAVLLSVCHRASHLVMWKSRQLTRVASFSPRSSTIVNVSGINKPHNVL